MAMTTPPTLNAPLPALTGSTLAELPDQLLYTVAQMLNPTVALAFDTVLRGIRKPVYSIYDRAYLRLLQRLQWLEDVVHGDPAALAAWQARVLTEVYQDAWVLLSYIEAEPGSEELIYNLMQLLRHLPQKAGWPEEVHPDRLTKVSVSRLIPLLTYLAKHQVECCL